MSFLKKPLLKKSILAIFIAIITPVSLIAYYSLPGFFQAAIEFTGYGGSGADGALVIDGTTNGPSNPYFINEDRTYTTSAAASGQTLITVNDASSFANGDEVLVIQMKGTGAGNYETKTISSIDKSVPGSHVITLNSNLTFGYTSTAGANAAQVIRVEQFSSVTINSGGYLTVDAWDGQTGGVMFFRASGPVNIVSAVPMSGTIAVSAKGFRGQLNSDGEGPTALAGGGLNKSPGTQRAAMMGSAGDASNGTGGNGGGVMIIKTAGTLTMDGTINLNGGDGVGVNAGGGAGGTAVISAHTVTKTGVCGDIENTGGTGIGGDPNGAAGRVFVLYNNTLGCQNNVTPSTNRTFLKYQVR